MASRLNCFHDRENDSTRFLITAAAILSCIYNALVAVLCAYMPDDPLKIALCVSLYAWSGTILSAFGLVGIVTRRTTLTTYFANFLLIDTFVSGACRFLILQVFAEAFWELNACGTHGFATPDWNPQNFRHGVVTSVRWQKENAANLKRQCTTWLDAPQIVLVAVLTCLTVGQGMLAVKTRRFAQEMELAASPRVGHSLYPSSKPRRSPQPSMVREKETLYSDEV